MNLYTTSIFQYLDFFCFLVVITLSVSFFETFSFFFLSGLWGWLVAPPLFASEEVDFERGSWTGSSGRLFSGALGVQRDMQMSCEIICFLPVWDDWMGQGNTSQRKCMWEGTPATCWGWETTDPDKTKAGGGDGPEAWEQDAWGSDWEAVRLGCVEYSVCVLCWCCRQCTKQGIN